MKRVDVFISNNNHHWQMMKPVLAELRERNVSVRLVSLCEFRRMETPQTELEAMGISIIRLFNLKKKGLKTSSGRSIGGNKGLIRNWLRSLVWQIKLKKEVVGLYQTDLPGLVIVPNDVAYPFDRICHWFLQKNIRFVLLQEGVRFPLPNEEGGTPYGMTGATCVMAWGIASVEYFQSLPKFGSPVLAVGNPRFDTLLSIPYLEQIAFIKSQAAGKPIILYVSNPIDDQGFCSHAVKMKLFAKFLEGLVPHLKQEYIRVAVRLHPRENPQDYQSVWESLALTGYVFFLNEPPLFACLRAVDCAVVLASTVGLEAMLAETPVAVVSIPGHGHVYNYVSSGAALGIDVEQDFVNELLSLLNTRRHSFKLKAKAYASQQVANRGTSAAFIAAKIKELIR